MFKKELNKDGKIKLVIYEVGKDNIPIVLDKKKNNLKLYEEKNIAPSLIKSSNEL